jgi:hypothetical protein
MKDKLQAPRLSLRNDNKTNSQRAWEKCQKVDYALDYLIQYSRSSKSGYWIDNLERKAIEKVIEDAFFSRHIAYKELVEAAEEDVAEAKARLAYVEDSDED